MTEAMADENRTPEQRARDNSDAMLELAGWKVQSKKEDRLQYWIGNCRS